MRIFVKIKRNSFMMASSVYCSDATHYRRQSVCSRGATDWFFTDWFLWFFNTPEILWIGDNVVFYGVFQLFY
jgi:hypothetical protein